MAWCNDNAVFGVPKCMDDGQYHDQGQCPRHQFGGQAVGKDNDACEQGDDGKVQHHVEEDADSGAVDGCWAFV